MAIRHTIKATNISLTKEIRAHVEKKLAQIEKLCDPKDTSTHVDIEAGRTTKGQHTGDVFRAEMTMHVAGAEIRAEAVRGDIISALDEVRQEIERQLRKHKTKKLSRVRKGAARAKEQIKRFYKKS